MVLCIILLFFYTFYNRGFKQWFSMHKQNAFSVQILAKKSNLKKLKLLFKIAL